MHYLFLLFCVIVYTTLEFVNLQYFNVILNLKRKTNLVTTFIILGLYGIIVTSTYYMNESNIIIRYITIIAYLYRFVSYPVILKKLSKKIIGITIAFYMIPYPLETIALYSFQKKIEYSGNIFTSLTETIILTIFLIIIKRKNLYSALQSSVNSVKTSSYFIILIFLFFNSAFIYGALNYQNTNFYRFIQFCTIFMIPVIIYLIIKISITSKQNEETNIILEKQLENQAEYYEKINKIYSEFRSFRHDYKNHILCIRNLIADNSIDEAVSYINEMSMTADNKQKYYDTGNTMINAMLTDKNEKASQSNTEISFAGIIPSGGIKNVDLCTIFANAIDNAIEACEKDKSASNKSIIISSKIKQGYYFLSISNPFFEKIISDDYGNISTSKSDEEYHGFGINNIKNAVKKYNGNTNIDLSNNMFKLKIELLLNQI